MAINIDTKGKPIRTWILFWITFFPLIFCAGISALLGFTHEFNFNLEDALKQEDEVKR